MQVKTTIPGLSEANKVMADIKRLGIQDVEPMYDKQVNLWGMFQVFRPSGKILLVNTPESYATAPILMWWCRDPKTLQFRVPNDQDLSDIVTTVKRAQVVFDKGSDWMVDQIEAKENADYTANRKAQSDRIKSFAKPLKKAFKKEVL